MLERNSGGFCSFCCCYSFIFFICRCFSFCWCCIFILFPGYFAMSPALHPSFSDPRRSPPALSSTPTTFDCLFFFIYCECYGFEWTFFNHRRFFLPNIFGTFLSFLAQPAFIKVLLGAGSYFFESCRASYRSSKQDPAHLFVWFTVIHSLLYILTLYLCMSILQVLLVMKTLIRSAAILFSSHENIKQQPN